MGPFASSILAGACGATALTSVHELARKQLAGAPRMDLAGGRALARVLRAARVRPPRGQRLHRATLAADLASNTLWYALAGFGDRDRSVRRGLLLGLAAGVGAVVLTPRLGLGRRPVAAAPRTPWLTILWYTLGGVTAGAALLALSPRGVGARHARLGAGPPPR
jgi:hypothetical protein